MRTSRRGGFTLLEVILAMAILGLMATALYKVVETVLIATGEVEMGQSQNEEIYTFFNLMDETFRTMPEQALVSLTENVPNVDLEMRFTNHPQAFQFGAKGMTFGDQVLRVRESKVHPGEYELVLLMERPLRGGERTQAVELEQPELILMEGLSSMRWDCSTGNPDSYVSNYYSNTERPTLVRISLQKAEDGRRFSKVFYLSEAQPDYVETVIE